MVFLENCWVLGNFCEAVLLGVCLVGGRYFRPCFVARDFCWDFVFWVLGLGVGLGPFGLFVV
jgi:hypothetical protein